MDRKMLVRFIMQAMPLASNIANDIAVNFEPAAYQKNDFLLKQGQISREYLFLEEGFLRVFTHDTEGDEVTTNLYGSNAIVFDAASYIKRVATKENVQALSDCTGWVVKHETFEVLFHSHQPFREFARNNLVNNFIALKERTLGMINLTAEQRYEHLLEMRPEIFQHVPLKYIASYLGVTDTSLSRIRKERMHR
jgi:CRP-like cAMP-binding protein